MTYIEKLKSITHCPICKRELQRLNNGRSNYCYAHPKRIECELSFFNDGSIYFYVGLNETERFQFGSHNEYGDYIERYYPHTIITPFHIDWILDGTFLNKIKAINLLK